MVKKNDRESKGSIVIIDDNRDNLSLLAELLKTDGYHVRPVRDGKTGLNLVCSQKPDLVLLDILMPYIDGFQICREIKANPDIQDIPIIFITALLETEKMLRGFALGGTDYITKPFNAEEVLARVRAHIRIRQLQRRLDEENSRLRALEDACFEGVLLHDEGRILDVNNMLATMFGATREKMINKHVRDLVVPALRQFIQDRIVDHNVGYFEVEGMKLDGSIFPVQVKAKTLRQHNKTTGVMTFLDVSRLKQLENENRSLKTDSRERYRLGLLLGNSRAMQEIYEQIASAAASDFSVLITGESGTGKELVARMIHQLSPRSEKPFCAVNCGAVHKELFEREFFGHFKGAFTGAVKTSEGFFDSAKGGTLFLDEVGELIPQQQVKLLRALQTGEYIPVGGTEPKIADVRIIAATNKDIKRLREKGRIRDDFFYRIHVITIDVPPLRQRKEDMPLLIEHFLDIHGTDKQNGCLPNWIVDAMYQYNWPGNVRELENELQRYLVNKKFDFMAASKFQLKEDDTGSFNLPQAIKALEKQFINEALRHTGAHRGKMAALLGISRRTLYQKLKTYGLDQ